MKCNCIVDIEKKLNEKYTAELGVEVKVECQNIAFTLIGNAFNQIHFTNYKVTAPVKGFAKGMTMPVHANFCPFCGKSAKEEVE